MKRKEFELLKNLLLKKKTELENRIADREEKLKFSQQESAGDLSSYPTHMGDIGSDVEQREQSVHFYETLVKELQRVNRALEKTESKEYGICEKCRKKISFNRLKAIPYAELCIKCGENL